MIVCERVFGIDHPETVIAYVSCSVKRVFSIG